MGRVIKELMHLLLWGSAGCLLVPAMFWWLGSQGIVLVPGLEHGAFQDVYRQFMRHLHEPLILVAVAFPYVLSIALRVLIRDLSPPGSTVIGLAVTRGESSTVEQLIEQGENLNDGNAAGETPLHLAAMQGDTGMTYLLLESGAELNAADHAVGYTPLQIAALQGHSAICEALIRYGADVDALTSRHETALHLAARAGHSDVVAVLLKYRAHTKVRNKAGQTARQLAEQQGHDALVSLMDQHATSEWPYLRLSNG